MLSRTPPWSAADGAGPVWSRAVSVAAYVTSRLDFDFYFRRDRVFEHPETRFPEDSDFVEIRFEFEFDRHAAGFTEFFRELTFPDRLGAVGLFV
jgi:hypothetical protein